MSRPSSHLVVLSRIALLVAIGDYATKSAAARFVSQEPTIFAGWLRFAVVHNDKGAFGFSAGTYTWQLNLALTLSAIALMIPVTRDLAKVDEHAPRALGLIVGGAIGNLLSLILSPRGVIDFISLTNGSTSLVLNVADVAAYVGLAMICRTGVLIVNRLRTEASVGLRSMPVIQRGALSLAVSERQIELPKYAEVERSPQQPAMVDPIPRPASRTPPRREGLVGDSARRQRID